MGVEQLNFKINIFKVSFDVKALFCEEKFVHIGGVTSKASLGSVLLLLASYHSYQPTSEF
jgi:hypothetical protein